MDILVVDDDLYNRQMVGYVLEEAGHTCHYAENGEEAISAWREVQPDLILMDVMMPVLNGYEAASVIKAETGTKHVAIVFLTALTEDKALVQCLDVGDDFLSKPINFVMLQAKIRAHARTISLNRQVVEQNKELAYFRSKTEAEFEMTSHIMAITSQLIDKNIPGIRSLCTAASAFNGDLVLTHVKKDGGVFFAIGDFTGHGLAASVGSIPVSQAFRTMTKRNLSVSEITREVNSILEQFLPCSMFFAATFGEVNAARTRMELWCGGLPDSYIVDETNQIRRTIDSTHMPMGILTDAEFESDTEIIELEPSDRVFFHTDGITECVNTEGEMFGESGLIKVLCSQQDDLFEAVVNALHEYHDQPEQQDDISIFEIDCRIKPDLKKESSEQSVNQEMVEGELPLFQMQFEWGPEHLKQEDPLLIPKQWLAHHAETRDYKEIIFLVLSELFNNSLEHGLLDLNSTLKAGQGGFDQYYQEREKRLKNLKEGFIKAFIFQDANRRGITIKIKDSGPGFEYNQQSLEETEDSFGRGLPLVNALCRELFFSENGAAVRVFLELTD